MLKKHLAVMLLFVMAAGVFSQSIPSGTGRYEALGNTPFILDAATDIFNNPAWNTQYRDYSFGDIGRNVISDFELSDQYAGATFGLGKKLNLGLIVNRRSDNWDFFNSDGNFGPNANGVSAPVVPFMGLIGYSLSKTFYLGLAPYVAMWKHDREHSTEIDSNRSSRSLGANLGAIYMAKKYWVEGTVRFRMNKFESEAIDSNITYVTDNDGGIELGVNLRGWFPTKAKTVVVPVLGFYTTNFTANRVAGSVSTAGADYSLMLINGGVGLNIPVTDDIQLAGGIVAEYNTYKVEFTGDSLNPTFDYKSTDFVLPRFHMAGETRIADWLTGRFGFNRAVIMNSEEFNQTAGGTTITINDDEILGSNTIQTVSLGAGFHFGRFSIDATVSERWLKQGINFVSGQSTDLFGVVSASYNFSK